MRNENAGTTENSHEVTIKKKLPRFVRNLGSFIKYKLNNFKQISGAIFQ